ncbi:hypothetical protein SDC9_177237 [bioreactor metagenome]|uniref:Uncharacterized protein n=1 Tax=bioreactor metagenome TaxID=1076179 RepID=A0A645H0E6_9ZZZZ
MGFIQVLDDGHGLREQMAVVQLQRGHQCIADTLCKGRIALLCPHQVQRHVVICQPFERQRYAHPKRCRRAEIVVELHTPPSIRNLAGLRQHGPFRLAVAACVQALAWHGTL